MSQALLFPGQGSQEVGMGRELARAFPEAARVFRDADGILGVELSRIAWEGPEEELTRTHNAQPAILTHSIAVHRVLLERLGPVSAAAGHSLGEFSAYVAAGSLAFEDALEAVRLRGELMSRAGQARPGTMAAVLGLEDGAVEAVCSEASTPDEICVPANFNTSGQVVISGDVAAVGRASEVAMEAGAKRVVPLSVSGAFHSPLMKPAEEGLRVCLEALEFSSPAYPVASNVTADLVEDGDTARELLVRQLTSPVRWAACARRLVQAGTRTFMELGPGKVLCGLNRRNAPGLPCAAFGQPRDLEALDDLEA